MADDVKTLAAIGKKNSEEIGALTKTVTGLVDKLSKTPVYPPGANPGSVFGAPYVRTGEDPLTSRGFSFIKMLGVMTDQIDPSEAKVEVDVSNRLRGCFKTGDWYYKPGGMPTAKGNHFLCPLSTSMLPVELVDRTFRKEMKSLVMAGVDSADMDEMRWIRERQMKSLGYDNKAMSWLNEFNGGSLVAPPEMGELIELLRNKEALVNAGARTVPLPPQGRIVFPRQTGASTTYWVGENAPITTSQPNTGQVILSAKKLAVLVQMPNELVRFASPAAEALVRDDMTKSLALGLDLAGLEAIRSDTRPGGIINYPNINTVTSSQTGTNGDYLVGTDAYRMIAAVEESNAEFEAWIMRPKTCYKYFQLRADAVAQGDRQGAFLFDMMRSVGDGAKTQLAGYPVIKSTQVSQSRAKGTATNLTYVLGGMFSDVLIGMFGAIEFAATTQGDTAFVNDQTWVRGILSADINLRHEASFVLMDNIDTTL